MVAVLYYVSSELIILLSFKPKLIRRWLFRLSWQPGVPGGPGEPRAADLRRGEAARVHRGPGRGLLGHPHGLQHLALPAPQEEERAGQHLRGYQERY